MKWLANPHKGAGLTGWRSAPGIAMPSDPARPKQLFARCPVASESPLVDATRMAAAIGIGRLFIKDERDRLGLGSFKSLGAAHAIARMASDTGRTDLSRALSDQVFVCASAGNHGLSVAAGAAVFGARSVVYLAETVPEAFAERLREKGAEVVREGHDYEASMAAAMRAAEANGWYLLSDSTWPGYSEPALGVMEGYLIMAAEVADQVADPPTHIFLQAGVGGLAAACAMAARRYWGDKPKIIIVEPDAAPALFESVRAGEAVSTTGPASAMGRLDCKEPSHVALEALAKLADAFMLLSEDECAETVAWLDDQGMPTSPSGAAGLAGLRCATGEAGLDGGSRVLVYVTEARPDG